MLRPTEPSIQQLVGLPDQMVSVCTPGEVDAEVVNTAPLHQVIHLLSVIGLIVVGVASHYFCVVRKLEDVTAGVSRKQLYISRVNRRPCVEPVLRVMGEDGVVVPHGLRSVGQEAQDPIPQCGAQSKGEELLLCRY